MLFYDYGLMACKGKIYLISFQRKCAGILMFKYLFLDTDTLH